MIIIVVKNILRTIRAFIRTSLGFTCTYVFHFVVKEKVFISLFAKRIRDNDFELTICSEIKILIAKNFANPCLPPSVMMMSRTLMEKRNH